MRPQPGHSSFLSPTTRPLQDALCWETSRNLFPHFVQFGASAQRAMWETTLIWPLPHKGHLCPLQLAACSPKSSSMRLHLTHFLFLGLSFGTGVMHWGFPLFTFAGPTAALFSSGLPIFRLGSSGCVKAHLSRYPCSFSAHNLKSTSYRSIRARSKRHRGTWLVLVHSVSSGHAAALLWQYFRLAFS